MVAGTTTSRITVASMRTLTPRPSARKSAAAVRAGAGVVAVASARTSPASSLSVNETPLEAGLRYENELHVICMSDKGRLEGIKAFQEKRDAKF